MKNKLRCGFSHNYPKLWGQTSGKLLEVKRVNQSELSDDAIAYDCRWVDNNQQPQTFQFEQEKLLRLTFIGNKGIPFTTYRKDTVENYEKYIGNIGETFETYVR